jgi:hypothetical protein
MPQSVTNSLFSSSRKISLLLSDMDGTLVTKEKILTDLLNSSASLSRSCSNWQTEGSRYPFHESVSDS